MEKSDILIKKTDKYRKISGILNITYLGLFLIFIFLEVLLIALEKMKSSILIILSIFLVIFWILYIVNVINTTRYANNKILPAVLQKDRIVFSNQTAINLSDVKDLKVGISFITLFEKLFKVKKKRSFGTIILYKNSKKAQKLYFVENVNEVYAEIKERLV